jgi:glucose/arabinose dehydrogenase
MLFRSAEGTSVIARRHLLVISLALLASVAVVLAVGRPTEGAAILPNGFERSTVAGILDRPTVMALAPGDRILVVEQGGRVRVVKNGQLLSNPLLNLSGRVDSQGERGLVGLTLDSEFARGKPFVYVYYTLAARNGVPLHNVIARFRVNGDRVVPGPGKRLARLPNLRATNHNGGALSFGRDGRL